MLGDVRGPQERRSFMKYVDGYVLPIPKKNLPTYRRLAEKGAAV
jgi:hypothetical protein